MRAFASWVAALVLAALAFSTQLRAENVQTLYNITHGNEAGSPNAALTNVNGLLYGTLSRGGANYAGAIFQLDPRTGVQKTVYSLAQAPANCFVPPDAPLVELSGQLYGILQCYGPAGYGEVFSFNPATGAGTMVYAFTGGSDGRYPTSLIAVNGALYGTTYSGGIAGQGVVFRIDPSSGAETLVHAFDADEGAGPMGLTFAGAALYGTTYCGPGGHDGTLFKIDLSTGDESTLHVFSGANDGAAPAASPIVIQRVLYGTASSGGADGYGTVYKYDISSGAYTTLYAFSNDGDGKNPFTPVTYARGKLFGTATCVCNPGTGVVYQVDPVTGAEKTLHVFQGSEDGGSPFASLIVLAGKLYGTTVAGGRNADGTVFSIDLTSGAEAVVCSFRSSPRLPNASMIYVAGMLYGTTSGGGPLSYGTIFQLNAMTGQLTTLYAFTGGQDDGNPGAALVFSQGVLFGTTSGAELPGSGGSVFTFDPTSGVLTTLYKFSGGADGVTPYSALLPLNGLLYGTTELGGTHNSGTVFNINPSTGVETVVYSFTGFGDGGIPLAGLTNVGGILFGTTSAGGLGGTDDYEYGTVYKIDPSTGVETPVYAFPGGSGGSAPLAPLAFSNGYLYGTTSDASVFAVNPANGGVYTVCSIPGSTAAVVPIGPYLFGTVSNGFYGAPGSLFSCNAKTSAVQTLYTFTGGADGGDPASALTPTGRGVFGVTSMGGSDAAGTVYKVLTQ